MGLARLLPRKWKNPKVHCTGQNALEQIDERVEDVNLDDLWKYIFELWKQIEKGNYKKACILRPFPWPNVPGLQDLKGIVLLRSDLRIKDIHGGIKAILGRVNVATVAPLVVAHTLELLAASITNTEELWRLTKVMYDLAIVLKRLSESPKGTQDVMVEATSLIVEGARVFSLQSGSHRSESEVHAITAELYTMKRHIEFTVLLSKGCPSHAGWILYEKNLLSTGRQKVFKMKALKVATENFHENNKVGEGGFGAVYKGTHDGKQIAVKKMSLTSKEERKEFVSEKLLAEVQHRNIVKLLGLCEQASQGFLVYEYFPNGSLDKFLFVADKRKELDWEKRYNIILGVACGLSYIHEHAQRRIVHRDIKPSNILLDENLIPKIADFGTAKLFPEDRTHVTATNAVGTFGYKAPEYAMLRQITVKTDVYSFGVVLLELLTGEKILSEGFLERVWSSYTRKEVADTIDRTITETWDKEKGEAKAKALRCFQVALLCIQNDAERRPTMSQVITMLSSSDSLSLPTKPPLVFSPRRSFSDEVENDNSTMEK